jgi:hypothetical protein
MKLDLLTHPGDGNVTDYFREQNTKYTPTKFNILADCISLTGEVPVMPAPTPFGDVLEPLLIIPGKSQMLLNTLSPGSSHIRLGSTKPHAIKCTWSDSV